MAIRAVFFDVDFTLIEPGPMFRADGYQTFCTRHGIAVDPGRFADAVSSAAKLLDGPEDAPYDAEVFVAYTRHIIERMGGHGAALDACAREIYAEWAGNHHFDLYEDVAGALSDLARSDIRIGLISNSHRCLVSFQSHFELRHLVSGAVSSSEHGYLKPHRSIFEAAMRIVNVGPSDSVMVGDSVRQDIEGALRAGMGAVLIHRSDSLHPREQELAARGVPTIRSLAELQAAINRISWPLGSSHESA